MVSALLEAARQQNVPVHKGIVLTQALFYPGFLESTVKLYAKAGVKAMENEVASLLVVASPPRREGRRHHRRGRPGL